MVPYQSADQKKVAKGAGPAASFVDHFTSGLSLPVEANDIRAAKPHGAFHPGCLTGRRIRGRATAANPCAAGNRKGRVTLQHLRHDRRAGDDLPCCWRRSRGRANSELSVLSAGRRPLPYNVRERRAGTDRHMKGSAGSNSGYLSVGLFLNSVRVVQPTRRRWPVYIVTCQFLVLDQSVSER